MERLVNKHERGQIQHVEWLDRLFFRAMDKAKEKCERTENLYPSLVVEFCSFEHRVVFQVIFSLPLSLHMSFISLFHYEFAVIFSSSLSINI